MVFCCDSILLLLNFPSNASGRGLGIYSQLLSAWLPPQAIINYYSYLALDSSVFLSFTFCKIQLQT